VAQDGRVSDELSEDRDAVPAGHDDTADDSVVEAGADDEAPRLTRAQAFAFRISGRLNKITRLYLGPAQVGRERRATEIKPLTSSPCPLCGRPMSEHDLVHSDTGRQRFYCPERR
jgi:hypothetical protein